MKFQELLQIVGDEPLFETGLLLVGDIRPEGLRVQLARWVASGRLLQLRRGLYALAPPYRRVSPHPFLVANRLVPGAYVSLESALVYAGMIPEYVAETQSVGLGRSRRWVTPLGAYALQHIGPRLLFGYRRIEVAPAQWAYCADPNKALLDLVHLRTGSDSREYLASLRLQALDQLDPDVLTAYAQRADSPKLLRAAERIAEMVRDLTQKVIV